MVNTLVDGKLKGTKWKMALWNRMLLANIPGPPTQLTEVTKKMSTVVQTDDLRRHNKSKVKDDADVIQTDSAATIKNITRGANEFLLSRNRQELDPM